MNEELLKKLTQIDAISGHEQEVYDCLKNELNDYADDIYQDKLGSFIAKKGDHGLKIMLAAHMDEVGFMVKSIDDAGFISFACVGGWYNQVLLGQKVCITTYSGNKIYGIIGAKPPHVLSAEARKQPVDFKDMFIDIGVYNKQEVLDLGINIGDQITPVGHYMQMANTDFIMAKAMDNRVGCYIMCEVIKQLQNEHKHQIYGVATVQEEVGLRGATTSSNLINPDIAIAIDTGIAGDTPKMTKDESISKLGDGPQIMIFDATTIGSVKLRNKMLEVANQLNINVQLDFTPGGGTDAGKMHLAHDGALGMSISIPTRYIHSHLSIINKKDVNDLITLLVAFCKSVDESILGES